MPRPLITIQRLQLLTTDLIDNSDAIKPEYRQALNNMINTRFEIYQQSRQDTIKKIMTELDKAENMNDNELRDLIYSVTDKYGGQ